MAAWTHPSAWTPAAPAISARRRREKIWEEDVKVASRSQTLLQKREHSHAYHGLSINVSNQHSIYRSRISGAAWYTRFASDLRTLNLGSRFPVSNSAGSGKPRGHCALKGHAFSRAVQNQISPGFSP